MNVIANTEYGKIEGFQEENCLKFLGVPFAQPPVGKLRFRRPKPPKPWAGVKQCLQWGDYCVQPGKKDTSISMSEDCLTLNIFTPACDGKKRPVAIWIHGGAYLTGKACEQFKTGSKLCQDFDLVVVSIQYRLGAFGCVDFSSLSGANGCFDVNCGTWDQVTAINWVINNISHFGGDPNNIGLMGESAGGCSVLTLITSPYLKGKIKRAVLESPAPFLINTKENGRKAALRVIKNLGVAEKDVYKLTDMSAQLLTSAVEKSEYQYVNYRPNTIPTAPVIDGDLIPESPFDAVMHGAADKIEVLIGTTKDEATLFVGRKKTDLMPSTPEQLERFFKDHPSIEKEKILELYLNYPDLSAFQEIGKEIFFHIGCIELAEHLTRYAPAYMYHFEYAAPILRLLKLRAAHCSNSIMTAGYDIGWFAWFAKKTTNRLIQEVHTRWGNFLSTGNVNGNGMMGWKSYGADKNTYIFDGKKSYLKQMPFEKERKAYGVIRPYGN